MPHVSTPTRVALGWLLWISTATSGMGLFSSDGAAGEPAKDLPNQPVMADLDKETVAALIVQLGSDVWSDRESATKKLSNAGAGNLDQMAEALRTATDPEVLQRLTRALLMAREIPIEGVYKKIHKETWASNGRRIDASNDLVEGTLTIAEGKAVWIQEYGNETVKQTYSVKGAPHAKVKASLDVPVTWDSIETESGYSPDKLNTKLVFDKVSGKLNVVLYYQDLNGHRAKVTFERTEP